MPDPQRRAKSKCHNRQCSPLYADHLKASASETPSSASASEAASASIMSTSRVPFKDPFRFLVEFLLSLLLFSRFLLNVLLRPRLGSPGVQILVLDPSCMCSVLAAHDLILTRRVSASIGAESCDVVWADLRVLDVSHRAVRSQWTKAARVVRARWSA
jgi:hypothetical protein